MLYQTIEFELAVVGNKTNRQYSSQVHGAATTKVELQGDRLVGSVSRHHCQNQLVPSLGNTIMRFRRANPGLTLSAFEPDLKFEVTPVLTTFKNGKVKYVAVARYDNEFVTRKVMGGFESVASPLASPFLVRLFIDAVRTRVRKGSLFWNADGFVNRRMNVVHEAFRRDVGLVEDLYEAWGIANRETPLAYASYASSSLWSGKPPAKYLNMFPPRDVVDGAVR